jgi:glucose-1-phosphate cytidylyltransferase
MFIFILAGGFGTRITEESHLRPKPMIEIGGQPILWHIMKMYSKYGFNDFVILAGYKQEYIKDYFTNYFIHRSDITFDFTNSGKITIHSNVSEPWRVTVLDTGLNTMTGGRILRAKEYLHGERFMLTYGDAVSDVNINTLLEYHVNHGKKATLTAIQPGGRFGTLEMTDTCEITSFAEKRKEDGGWINGGFMVLEPEVLDYLEDDTTVFERAPLERLSAEGQLKAYTHYGFWQCMDTLRDKMTLDEMCAKGETPWLH